MKKKNLKPCFFRLPSDLKDKLDKLSKERAIPKSKLIIEALEDYLGNESADDDFSFAIEALEELKDGDYKKASKKIDKVVKKLKHED